MERILNKGVNANSLKELNRRTLLRLLKKNDICSRADLAKKCGLKPATVTKIINNFIEIGLVKETGIMDGEKGRRSIGVRLNTEDFAVIGVRLTRTYVEIGRFDLRGELIKKKRIDFDFEKKPRLVLEQIVGETKRLIEQDKKRDVLAVGVAVPGPYFPDEGKMHKMTEFPGWDDICFNKEVVSAFNIPVIIDHDANAGALAEWWLSEDSFEKSTIYLAVGEGVGAGVVVNGDLFKGAYGTAGEIGHMSIDYNGMQCECGNKGCLTLYGSVFYLMRNIKKRIANGEKTVLTENFSMEEVVMAAKHRDKITCEEISKVGFYLGIGIVNMICAYSPDEVIIGDQMARLGDEIINSIKKTVKSRTLEEFYELSAIRLSEMKEDSAFIGAGSLAIDYVLGNSEIVE